MFCRKCGCQLPDGAACCSNCGANLLPDDVHNNNDKKVLEDKPYLTPREFINSPYGESLKKDYKKVNLLCWLAQIVATLICSACVIVLFVFPDTPDLFAIAAVIPAAVLFVLHLWACSQVRKKLTKASAICMIIVGYTLVFGAIFGAFAISHVIKIENAYKEYMYT